MRKIVFPITILFFVACSSKPMMEKVSQNGIWQQVGYGKVIKIQNDSVYEYDVCKIDCSLSSNEPLAELGLIESVTNDSLFIRKNIKTYKYFRLNKLPENCDNQVKDQNDPIHNFEVLWHTFNEQYAYFEKRNIDWTSVYTRYKSRINKETTDIELFSLFDELLSSLNDGHVSIDMPDNLKEALKQQKKEEQKEPKLGEPEMTTFDLGLKTQWDIANYYCKNIKSHNGGVAKWGMMDNNIAYVQINAMLFLAYYDLPTDLTLEELWPLYWGYAEQRTYQRQDEIDGANRLMDTILSQLSNADAYVLDLRFNIGGKDEAALAIIGHFVDKRRKVASKKARLKDTFCNHQNVFLEPKQPNFLGKVYVLTSHQTASAAEIASLSTVGPNNIIRIGSNTEGIFSDGLDKKLPNGWEYTLSNEEYIDVNGVNYEGIGVSPDINLNYPKDKREFYTLLQDQLESKGDQAIQTIFRMVHE